MKILPSDRISAPANQDVTKKPAPSQVEKPSWEQVKDATMQREGMMTSHVMNLERQYIDTEYDAEYNPFVDTDLPEQYRPAMTNARNKQHAMAIVSDLEREEQNARINNEAGWGLNFWLATGYSQF